MLAKEININNQWLNFASRKSFESRVRINVLEAVPAILPAPDGKREALFALSQEFPRLAKMQSGEEFKAAWRTVIYNGSSLSEDENPHVKTAVEQIVHTGSVLFPEIDEALQN